MIKCPQCGATLPEGGDGCQFRGATFAEQRGGKRPVGPAHHGVAGPSFIDKNGVTLYYVVAAWWILNGAYGLLSGLLAPSPNTAAHMAMMGWNILTALVGVGLVFRVEAVRGAVRVLALINVILAVVLLGLGVIGLAIAPGPSLVLIAIAVLGIVLYGLTIKILEHASRTGL